MKIDPLPMYPVVADKLDTVALRLNRAATRLRGIWMANDVLRDIDWRVTYAAREYDKDRRAQEGVRLYGQLKRLADDPKVRQAPVHAVRRRVLAELLDMPADLLPVKP